MNVAVVGAGLAGLACAVDLARAGAARSRRGALGATCSRLTNVRSAIYTG